MSDKSTQKQKLKFNDIIVLIVFVFGLCYTFLNRPFFNIITSSFTIFLFLTLLLLIIYFITPSYKSKNKIFYGYKLVILYLISLSIVLYSANVILTDINSFIKLINWEKKSFVIPLIITLVLIFALFLFYIRIYYRIIYGVAESLVGIYIAVLKISSMNGQDLLDETFYIAILTGAFYLMVRGFDNIYIGFTDKKDAFLVLILKEIENIESKK